MNAIERHMTQEEAELFPVLERVLAAREVPREETSEATAHVTEAMVVNRVIREFPATKRVFESLFVNVPFEGCDCLDEVAWRRGMEARDLIDKLETVIASCRCSQSEGSKQIESITAPCDSHHTKSADKKEPQHAGQTYCG